jgi:hypothetical protein
MFKLVVRKSVNGTLNQTIKIRNNMNDENFICNSRYFFVFLYCQIKTIEEMKQEDKDLLLKDLCARLRYNPLVEYKGESYNVLGIAHGRLVLCKPFMSYTLNECPLVEEVKPCLFPLSSMTEEQKKEEYEICKEYIIGYESNLIDFYNKYHLDYRGLIPKGLALDATGLNIY